MAKQNFGNEQFYLWMRTAMFTCPVKCELGNKEMEFSFLSGPHKVQV